MLRYGVKHLLEYMSLVIGRAPSICDVQWLSAEGGTGDVGQRMPPWVKQTHHKLPDASTHPHLRGQGLH